MINGHFYYISDKYFQDFQDDKLMSNKEIANGISHDRPCFYAFQDKKTKLFWLIPISSQVEKYKAIYARKLAKYHRCDTLFFAEVLGYEKIFLLQNMCPVSQDYIKNEYFSVRTGEAVKLKFSIERELTKKAKKVLAMHRKGISLIFPDVSAIEMRLLKQL